MITSHVGLNPTVAKMMNSGELELKLVPQGTLIEQIRAKGSGLGGVLTKTPAVIDMIKAVRTLQADPERLNHMSSIMNQHRKQVAQSHFTAKIVKLYKKLLASSARMV